MQYISIKNLHFRYPLRKTVYKNINVNIQKGNIYALFGTNGAGKTTLLNIISGLLKIKDGSCKVFGHESKERNPAMLEELFIVSADMEFPDISLKKYISLYAGFYPNYDFDLLARCLKEFNLSINADFDELSFGDKKKAYLSFALATRCKLILFDEPTIGLDIPSKSSFRKLVSSAFTDEQTFIIATHQVSDISNLVDHIIIENKGKIILDASVESISNHLAFNKPVKEIEPQNLIYSGNALDGKDTVSINSDNVSEKINIELLFQAALQNHKRISATLKN